MLFPSAAIVVIHVMNKASTIHTMITMKTTTTETTTTERIAVTVVNLTFSYLWMKVMRILRMTRRRLPLRMMRRRIY